MGVYKLSGAGSLTTGRTVYKSMLAGNPTFFPLDIQYLVLAGGGGGTSNSGGGGGAGGFRSNRVGQPSGRSSSAESQFIATPATNYTVTVGAAGAGSNPGTLGGNSVFSTITSLGGGRAHYGGTAGLGGGSGAGRGNWGGRTLGTAGQGHDGGDNVQKSTGGGTGSDGNAGGGGTSSDITGTSITRGFGGNPFVQAAPAVNTGSGGGAGSGGSITYQASNGSSGVVILRYPNIYTITIGAGLTGTTSTVSSDRVTTLTAGTGNVSWN